jgi:hypothetical protein
MMKARLFFPTFAILAALTGCEGQPDNGPAPIVKTQAMIDAQIQKIQADPNMSPQAKEAAIQSVQRGFEASKQEAESAKNVPPKR